MVRALRSTRRYAPAVPVLDPTLLQEAVARWPTTAWTINRIAAHFGTLADGAPLAGAHRGDLLWAWACLEGDPTALAELETGPIATTRAHLRALGCSPDVIDEAVQRARTKLVIDRGLASYHGRGPLGAFARTTIVRLAIDDRRRVSREVELDQLTAAPGLDPELAYMRKLYGDELAGAVRDAWARLAGHEQFVLSLRVFDAMSIDDVARVYDIHRASAARRVAAARASLVSATRACLRERLSVGETTLDSILRIVTSSVQLPSDAELRDAMPR
jgi:RNA polymerase sigma-70 factor, ECF subfamily